jgi:hypothetical protein
VVAVPELITVEDWLYETLSAAVAVPVYSGIAPENAPYAVCVFAYLDSNDLNAIACGEQRVMTRFDYAVRMSDRSESFTTIAAGAQAIDEALQGGKGLSEVGGQVLSCSRESPFVQRETDPNGQQYLSLGGVYRIFVEGGP